MWRKFRPKREEKLENEENKEKIRKNEENKRKNKENKENKDKKSIYLHFFCLYKPPLSCGIKDPLLRDSSKLHWCVSSNR